MTRDFGSGITFDDLIGLTALTIDGLQLPNDELGCAIKKASRIMVEKEFGRYHLMELWGDGHSVWQVGEEGQVVVAAPTGQLTFKSEGGKG